MKKSGRLEKIRKFHVMIVDAANFWLTELELRKNATMTLKRKEKILLEISTIIKLGCRKKVRK